MPLVAFATNQLKEHPVTPLETRGAAVCRISGVRLSAIIQAQQPGRAAPRADVTELRLGGASQRR